MSKTKLVRILLALLISVGAVALLAFTSAKARVQTVLGNPAGLNAASLSAPVEQTAKVNGRSRYFFDNSFGMGSGHDCSSESTSDY